MVRVASEQDADQVHDEEHEQHDDEDVHEAHALTPSVISCLRSSSSLTVRSHSASMAQLLADGLCHVAARAPLSAAHADAMRWSSRCSSSCLRDAGMTVAPSGRSDHSRKSVEQGEGQLGGRVVQRELVVVQCCKTSPAHGRKIGHGFDADVVPAVTDGGHTR